MQLSSLRGKDAMVGAVLGIQIMQLFGSFVPPPRNQQRAAIGTAGMIVITSAAASYWLKNWTPLAASIAAIVVVGGIHQYASSPRYNPHVPAFGDDIPNQVTPNVYDAF